MLRADLAVAKTDPKKRRKHFGVPRTSDNLRNEPRTGWHLAAIAQKLLRHSDIELTLEIYTRFSAEEVADAVEKSA